MADQRKEDGSDSLVQMLNMEDLSSDHPPRVLTSTPGDAEARLKSPENRNPSFHVINTSSSGEIQFRLPSRDVGRMNTERTERSRVDESRAGMLIGRGREVEESQVHNSEGGRLPRADIQGERPALELSPQCTERNRIIPRGDNYNQGYGRSRGLPRYNSPIRGEPIREREIPRRALSSPCQLCEDQGQGPSGCSQDWRGLPCNIYRGPMCDVRRDEGMHRERGHSTLRSGPSLCDVRRDEGMHRERDYQFDRGVQSTRPVVGEHRYRGRKDRKPATYDGTSNWSDYLVHFEIVADLNQWDNDERALELATSLRVDTKVDLRPENRKNFRQLVQALNKVSTR